MNEYSGMPEKASALEALHNLATLLDEIGSPEWEVEETHALVSRFKEVVSNVHSRLRLAGTSSITVSWLQEIEGNAQNLISLAQSLRDSSPGLGIDLRDANSQLDELVNAAAPLPAIPLRTTRQVVERALRQFDEQVVAERGAISRLVDAIQAETADSRNELERAKSDSNDHLSNQRREIEAQVEQMGNSLNELAGRTSEAVERLERDVTNNQEVFRQSQESREQAFLEAQAAHQEGFEGSTKSTLAELEGYRDQARDMLAEVGGAGSAEHYAKQRDTQRKNADFWRWIGIAAIGGLIGAAVWVYLDSASAGPDFSFNWLAGRTGLLGALVLLVTYALRQSGQHRRREEQIERVANELMLLWPFVNRLPDEDRLAVLLHVAPLYFKGGLPAGIEPDTAIGVERIRNAITQVIQKRANP